MKKYSKPAIEIVKIETEGMMTMSVMSISQDGETSVQYAPSRRDNDWATYYDNTTD